MAIVRYSAKADTRVLANGRQLLDGQATYGARCLCDWELDRAMSRPRNEIERLFRHLKGFRRIFSRFEKLDVMFLALIHFALIVESVR